jgi:hypothetical protein
MPVAAIATDARPTTRDSFISNHRFTHRLAGARKPAMIERGFLFVRTDGGAAWRRHP